MANLPVCYELPTQGAWWTLLPLLLEDQQQEVWPGVVPSAGPGSSSPPRPASCPHKDHRLPQHPEVQPSALPRRSPGWLPRASTYFPSPFGQGGNFWALSSQCAAQAFHHHHPPSFLPLSGGCLCTPTALLGPSTLRTPPSTLLGIRFPGSGPPDYDTHSGRPRSPSLKVKEFEKHPFS